MDDVDAYLSVRPRVKEWMPDLPGLHKLSKTETQQDMDQILANIAASTQQQQLQQQQQQQQLSIQQGWSAASATTIPETDVRSSSRKAQRAAAKNKEGRDKDTQTSNREGGAATSAADDAASSTPSRRSRLQAKILAERAVLEASHSTASQLRLELDTLRNEILSYEDAILQAKREIDHTKRERREVELNYNLIREEYELQIQKIEHSRRDAEETEQELRQRLTKSNQENVDLSERLNQLRQLEEEFKAKEAKIEMLTIDNNKLQRQLTLLEAISKTNKQATVTATGAAQTAAAESTAPTTTSASPSPASAPSSTVSSPSAISPGPAASSATSSPSAASSLSVSPEAFSMLSPEVLDAIRHVTEDLSVVERQAALLAEENKEQKIKLAEQLRHIASLIQQLERSTSVHTELTHAIKHIEAQLYDEGVKVEHSLKTIHLLQKQKQDQQTLLIGYEERMKHFQQLLTAADVRADSANTFLSELLKQWNVLKYANRQLQAATNRMKGEYRKMVRERNTAYDELHDKINRYREESKNGGAGGAGTSSTSSGSISSSPSASPPSTPPSLGFSAQQQERFWSDKEKKVNAHYLSLSQDNATLAADLDAANARIKVLEEQSKNMVPRTSYEESIQALHVQIDEMKRFCVEMEEKVKKVQADSFTDKEAALSELERKHQQQLQREREAASAAASAQAAAAAQASSSSSAVNNPSAATSSSPRPAAESTDTTSGSSAVKMEDQSVAGDEGVRSKKRKLENGAEGRDEQDIQLRENEDQDMASNAEAQIKTD